jgi:hypothetical protein
MVRRKVLSTDEGYQAIIEAFVGNFTANIAASKLGKTERTVRIKTNTLFDSSQSGSASKDQRVRITVQITSVFRLEAYRRGVRGSSANREVVVYETLRSWRNHSLKRPFIRRRVTFRCSSEYFAILSKISIGQSHGICRLSSPENKGSSPNLN